MRLTEQQLTELAADMAAMFKRHFRVEPTVIGPSGQLTTPFLAFAAAACADMGVRVSAAQLSDAGRRCGVSEDQG